MLFSIIGSMESRSSAHFRIGSIDYEWSDSRLCRLEVGGHAPGISWHGPPMHGSDTIRPRGPVTSVTRRPAIDRRLHGPRERFRAAMGSQHSGGHAQRVCESCVLLLQPRSTDDSASLRCQWHPVLVNATYAGDQLLSIVDQHRRG